MLGINARTGELRWITQVHPDPKGIMTGSPVVVGDTIFTGVSASGAGGPQATFRGAIVALNAHTGRILWQSYSLPDNGGVPGGYAGATMFAPPAVDVRAGLVYGTFGQPYTEPASVTACHAANGGFSESCEQPGSYLKSIVAFDLGTGTPRWSYRVQGHEPWLRACGNQPPAVTWCPAEIDGEKWDLGGSGANVFRLRIDRHWHNDHGRWQERTTHERHVVGIGGKSGVTLLDAETRITSGARSSAGRRPGRYELGHGVRWRSHLRLDHEPASHPASSRRTAFSRTRPRPAALGRARSTDWHHPLADS